MGPYRVAASVEPDEPGRSPFWGRLAWLVGFRRYKRCPACGATLPRHLEHEPDVCRERQGWIWRVEASERMEGERAMALGLDRILGDYEAGLTTQGEVMMFLSGALTAENLDRAVEWFRRHPEFARDLEGQPAREWFSSSGHRYVLTDPQFELMGQLVERVRGNWIGPDGVVG